MGFTNREVRKEVIQLQELLLKAHLSTAKGLPGRLLLEGK
jgi:hypothetical protein